MYFIQFVCIAIFMSLNGPAETCILVASVSPIHVPPIHVVVHTHTFYIHTYIRDPKQLSCKPASWGVLVNQYAVLCKEITPRNFISPLHILVVLPSITLRKLSSPCNLIQGKYITV